MAVQALPAEYYTPFLSDVAKERKPAPSQLTSMLLLFIILLTDMYQFEGSTRWKIALG